MATSQLDSLIKSLSDRLNEFERAGTFNPLSRGTTMTKVNLIYEVLAHAVTMMLLVS
jgi:hypothetical protein